MRLRTLAEDTPVEIRWSLNSDREASQQSRVEGDTAITTLTAELAAGETWTVEKRVRILARGEAAMPTAADPWAAHADAWRAALGGLRYPDRIR